MVFGQKLCNFAGFSVPKSSRALQEFQHETEAATINVIYNLGFWLWLMLVFAHLGLTLAAANLSRRFDFRPDLAFVGIGSLLPDMIDKPLGYMIYGSMATGRIYAHTLLFLLILATIAAALRSRTSARPCRERW